MRISEGMWTAMLKKIERVEEELVSYKCHTRIHFGLIEKKFESLERKLYMVQNDFSKIPAPKLNTFGKFYNDNMMPIYVTLRVVDRLAGSGKLKYRPYGVDVYFDNFEICDQIPEGFAKK